MKTASLPTALAQIPDLWRGSRPLRPAATLSTGHALLDHNLPGNGWPLGALTEILSATSGTGEFSLLLPAIAESTLRLQWAIMVDPPWIPYPPALCGQGVSLAHLLVIRTTTARESMWACEQALRHSHGGVVMAWPEKIPGFAQLRRLQLAAATGRKLAFLFHPNTAATAASPAALRLRLDTRDTDTLVTVLKCRGQRPLVPLRIRRTRIPGSTARIQEAVDVPSPPSPLKLPDGLQLPTGIH